MAERSARADDVDDIAQEAALRAWRHRDRCRSPEDPRSWLAAITRNEARRRHLSAARSSVSLEAAAELAEPDASIATAPDRIALQRAVSTLSARDRAIVLLHYHADLPVARVAEELVIPLGTVKVTLQRIRSKLRHLLP